MKLTIIASSSSGNSYMLKSGSETLLIECGVNFKEILKFLNHNLSKVIGLLLTHEHGDHSKSAANVLSYGIDLYTSGPTANALGLSGHRLNVIEPLKQFEVGNFKILPFEVQHDAALPLGYLIEEKSTGYRLLFATDTFYLRYKFPNLNGILIECNYISDTLDENIENGYIPMEHKPRLLRSHMSLKHLKSFLKANDLSRCQEIVLLHLSSRNSDAQRMVKEIEEVTGIKPKVATNGLEVELNRFPY